MYDKTEKGKNFGRPPPHLVVPDPQNPGQMKNILDKNHLRILGSNIQANMNWDSHLLGGEKAILPNIRRQLGSLKTLGNKIPMTSKKLLANGLLLSKFNYLIAIWGGGHKQPLTNCSKDNECHC